MPTSSDGDRGSVMLLQVFCVVVVVMAIAVICDFGTVVGARRELSALADQAAIAGAQAIDLDSYYAGGAQEVAGLTLSPAAVGAAVRRYLQSSIDARSTEGLRLERVEVDATGVTVHLSVRAALPFTALPAMDSAQIHASSRAALFVQAHP